MNPHFTFNTLSSIQQYILNNDSTKANDYLSKFATLIRHVLENTSVEFISLEDELESLEVYLSLEKLRFKDKLEYDLKIDPSIDKRWVYVPPFLVQPFVENAIVHGISNLSGKGRIEVSCVPNEQGFKIIIEDNGVGRREATRIKKSSIQKKQSMGIDIMKDRFNRLHDLYGKQYRFEIIDLKDENGKACGTRVIINIPK
jgi:LytS/YehU family sensor histidine kinase